MIRGTHLDLIIIDDELEPVAVKGAVEEYSASKEELPTAEKKCAITSVVKEDGEHPAYPNLLYVVGQIAPPECADIVKLLPFNGSMAQLALSLGEEAGYYNPQVMVRFNPVGENEVSYLSYSILPPLHIKNQIKRWLQSVVALTSKHYRTLWISTLDSLPMRPTWLGRWRYDVPLKAFVSGAAGTKPHIQVFISESPRTNGQGLTDRERAELRVYARIVREQCASWGFFTKS